MLQTRRSRLKLFAWVVGGLFVGWIFFSITWAIQTTIMGIAFQIGRAIGTLIVVIFAAFVIVGGIHFVSRGKR